MKVYRVVKDDHSHYYLAADTLLAAVSTAPEAMSVEIVGELTFAEDTDDPPPGGRKLTTDEIKATFTEDGQFLISLEDNKKYRSLKGHLKKFGLTMEQYRAKWGLPDTYPANSVAYSMRRAELARENGLGKR